MGDAHRGPTLEMILAKIINYVPSAQILALSATVSNTKDLAEWLKAELVETNWRPVEARGRDLRLWQVGICRWRRKETTPIEPGSPNRCGESHAVNDGGQSLIFCETRKRAVSMAEKAGEILPKFLSFDESGKLRESRPQDSFQRGRNRSFATISRSRGKRSRVSPRRPRHETPKNCGGCLSKSGDQDTNCPLRRLPRELTFLQEESS